MTDSSQNIEPVVQENQTPPEQTETMPKAEFQKVLDEMHKFKREAKEAKAQAEQIKLEKLKEQQNWQAIAELKEKEAVEYKEKYSMLSENLVFDKKLAAAREAAIKLGINQQAVEDLEMYDMSAIIIEKTSTNRINILGADQWASALKLKKPFLFTSASNKINPDTPSVIQPKSIGWDELKASEKAFKANPTSENKKKYESAMHEYARTQN